MCHLLNDMVANGSALQFEDTPVTRKATEIYHQLAEKGLLDDARKIEEKNRRAQASDFTNESPPLKKAAYCTLSTTGCSLHVL